MSKIIVERPRIGHSQKEAKAGRSRVVTDDDGAPLRAREPARTRTVKTKSFNENLSPLKRYLDGQVGRPWNKVFSEIAAHLKLTSTVQQHLRDHLEDFVAVRTCMGDGAVYVQGRFGGPRPLAQDGSLYFVHPKTGLLKRNVQRYCRSSNAAQDISSALRRVVSGARQYLFLDDGGWWDVRIGVVAQSPPEEVVDVIFRDGLSNLSPEDLYGRADVFAVHKRALSKAEKEALRLG